MKQNLWKKGLMLGMSAIMTLGAANMSFGAELLASQDGIEVRNEKQTYDDGYEYNVLQISYNGKSAEKLAREDGLTIAMRCRYEGQWYAWTPLDAYSSESQDGSYSVIDSFAKKRFSML